MTFLVILLGIAFGNLRIKGVGFGSSGVLIVAMLAGYLYQFEPIPILQDLGIVLFLLCVGLEAGPSFFRAFKRHGKRFITNVLVLIGVSGVNTGAIMKLADAPIGVGPGLFAGAFISSPALVSAMQFSPEEEVIFGYGVACPFGLLGVILFISIAVKLLRGRMEAEVRSRSQMHTAVHKLQNEALAGKLIRDIDLFQEHEVVVSGILRDLNMRTASGSTVLLAGDILRLEGLPENVAAVGGIIGEEVHEKLDESSELDTRSIVVENTSVVNRPLADLDIRLRYNVSITRVIRSQVEFVPRLDLALEYGDVVVAVARPTSSSSSSCFSATSTVPCSGGWTSARWRQRCSWPLRSAESSCLCRRSGRFRWDSPAAPWWRGSFSGTSGASAISSAAFPERDGRATRTRTCAVLRPGRFRHRPEFRRIPGLPGDLLCDLRDAVCH